MSRERRAVIWGAGGHASVVADIIRRVGWYDLVGFLDNVNPERWGDEFAHSIILGGREQLGILHTMSVGNIIVAIGDNEARLRIARDVDLAAFSLATAIDPRAALPIDIMVGGGTMIMASAVVQPGCRIGKNVIINTGATVDHDCIVGDGAHIAPGAHLGGNVIVYRGAFVGMGVIVVPGVTIGPSAIIGAGSVVLKNVLHSTTVYGNPARVAA